MTDRRKYILFVCTGNTCRSPMAQALLNRQISAAGLGASWMALSAGLHATVGAVMPTVAIEAAAELGLDIADHRACQLTEPLALRAQLIAVMTRAHRDELRTLFPSLSSRIHLTYSCYGGEERDIPDPFGQSLSAYRQCFATLTPCIIALFQKFIDSNRRRMTFYS